jgi:hypothetical protein
VLETYYWSFGFVCSSASPLNTREGLFPLPNKGLSRVKESHEGHVFARFPLFRRSSKVKGSRKGHAPIFL